MRVALFTDEDGFDAANAGGIGAYSAVVGLALAARGMEAHLIMPHPDRAEETQLSDGLYLHRLAVPARSAARRAQVAAALAEKAEALARSDRVDVLEAPEWLGPAHLVGRRGALPLLTRLHTPLAWIAQITGNDGIFADQAVLIQNEEAQIRTSRVVVAPSKAMAAVAMTLWGVEAIVVPNPIDETYLSGSVPPSENREKLVLYLGRLEPRKGVHVLAEALARVLSRDADARCVICGHDAAFARRSMRAGMQATLKEHLDRVTFLDHVGLGQKIDLIRRARAVVVPSIWENFPYVALEALALGAPVIATNAGGLPEIVSHGKNGFLVAPNDALALGEAIETALREGEKRFEGHAVRESVARFTPGRLMPEYAALYRRASAKAAPTPHSSSSGAVS